MKKRNLYNKTGRRRFLGNLTAGAATLGMGGMLSTFQELRAENPTRKDSPDSDAWFHKITGKHRIVYDVIRPNGFAPFAWARAFLLSNEETGTPATECNVVVVFRQDGIPFAFNSDIWSKYKFGEVFKYDDPATKLPAQRNPLWQPAPGQYNMPGLGLWAIGINQLQDNGVMFCVCNMAIKKHSAVFAQNMHLDPEQVKQEWIAGIVPGIQIMPAGVWALGRAQEHGCAYCFSG
jgi:intracellular sulfur oxidation DsrE/DsrF family protein